MADPYIINRKITRVGFEPTQEVRILSYGYCNDLIDSNLRKGLAFYPPHQCLLSTVYLVLPPPPQPQHINECVF